MINGIIDDETSDSGDAKRNHQINGLSFLFLFIFVILSFYTAEGILRISMVILYLLVYIYTSTASIVFYQPLY